ncbi:uncharacterized protein DUF2635 [Paraburkholderia sp. BL8N3]|nr:DUF2635 domain-containing protein [Paraburkholderia sp. BL8N3]TCK36725.1 uncharacterized protein DUF2635 [Paraburkholderia sp. BL8N3]
MRVKPAPGLSVRNPETKQLLPPEGIEVPDDSVLWTKILNDGDVVEAPPEWPPLTPPASPLSNEGDTP